MQHSIPELDAKGLREFGLLTGGFTVALFGLILPWIFNLSYPLWPWVLGGILGLWALAAPASLNKVYKTWMRFGLILSSIMTPLILGLVFFLVVTPMGIAMRAMKKDPLTREFDNDANSYRVISNKKSKHSLEKPY